MTLADAMRLLYSKEINCSISSFWDGGWDVRLGDPANGYKEETSVDDLEEAAPWLIEKAKEYFPTAWSEV